MKQCKRHQEKQVGKCSKGFPCVLLGECIYGHELIKDNEQAKFILRGTRSTRQACINFLKVAKGEKFTGIAKKLISKHWKEDYKNIYNN